MDINDIKLLIEQLGFPIFVTVCLLLILNKTLKKQTAEISKLGKIIKLIQNNISCVKMPERKDKMALLECPECGKQISEKAHACIYCGLPQSEISKSTDRRILSDKETTEIANILKKMEDIEYKEGATINLSPPGVSWKISYETQQPR